MLAVTSAGHSVVMGDISQVLEETQEEEAEVIQKQSETVFRCEYIFSPTQWPCG